MGSLTNTVADLIEDPSDLALSQLVALGCDRNGQPVNETASIAASYLLAGISIVPQIAGAKSPCVKWKPHQTEHASIHQVIDWYSQWPEAGVALVLGPVSDLFVLDVDGTEAHEALMQLLPDLPITPIVRSGSGKKDRYHVLFRHPDQRTNAKATPVHAKLEFKGSGGIVIAPPSFHKSGNRYEWVEGRSIFDVDRKPVPLAIKRCLADHFRGKTLSRNRKTVKQSQASSLVKTSLHLELSDRTLQFLSGELANKTGWNNRIFQAACDMNANGYPVESATELILAGARPWNETEVNRAIATIDSAYSQQRTK